MNRNNFTKRFLVAGLSLVFVFSPVLASAQTVESLQAQIASLLQQIKTLQAQLSQLQGGTGATWCHDFSTNLGVGNYSIDNDVPAIVQALSKESLTDERGSTYAHNFDESLASAVRLFQEKYKSEILTPAGLRAGTGYIGARTRAKLNSLYGCSKTLYDGGYIPTVVLPAPSTTNALSVSPASGKAPLTVTAHLDGCYALITWGDSTSPWESSYGMNSCGGGIPLSDHPMISVTHTYALPGLYTITLLNNNSANSKPMSIGSATVTITQ